MWGAGEGIEDTSLGDETCQRKRELSAECFSPCSELPLPLILVAAALGWTATDGFDLMLWAKTAVTVMALLIVSSVASNVLARATVRTDARLDPRTEPNDLKSET